MESDKLYFNVSDIRELAYCERIVWYRYVMGVPGVPTPQMEEGTWQHMEFERLEKRRRFKKYGLQIAERRFNVFLRSEALGLIGIADMLLILKDEKKAAVVEVKRTRFPELLRHVVLQLGTYAMMVEETMGYKTSLGFVYLVLQEGVKDIIINDDLREQILNSIDRLRDVVKMASVPQAPANRNVCGGCEYRRFCDDIW